MMPLRFQITLFIVLLSGALLFLNHQAKRIRDLEARHEALEGEKIAFEESAARKAANESESALSGDGPPRSAPDSTTASTAITTPIDPDVFLAEVRKAMASRSKEAGLALMQNHAAAIENADTASLKALLAGLRELPGEMQLFYTDMISRRLVVQEPAETIAALLADGASTPFALMRVKDWASRDPGSAIAWFRDPDASEKRDPFLQYLVTGLAERGPAEALEFAASLPPEDRLPSIRIIASQPLSARERREVLAVAAKLPGPQRISILQEVAASTLDQRGFRAAAAFVDSLDLEDADRGELALRVATGNLRDDPAGKGQWLLENSGSAQKGKNLAYFVSRWAEEDFNAAGEFLNSLDAGAPYHGRAVASYARKIAEKEPPTAVDWAGTITQEKLRADTLKQVYRAWAQKNRAAADLYFGKKGIDLPVDEG